MQSIRKFLSSRLTLKIASIAVAVAALSVDATRAPQQAKDPGPVHATVAVTSSKGPAADLHASETWSADESAAGTRPDAAH